MIGITIGDIAGIGPEITLKALSDLSFPKDKLVIIGNRKILAQIHNKFITPRLNLDDYSIMDAFDDFKYEFGKAQKKCGIASFQQLHLASYLLKIGYLKYIITAPVCKTALQMANFPYAGQTEYFAYEFGEPNFGMLAWSESVKILLVTIHKPLKEVPQLITTELVLAKIKLINSFLKRYVKLKHPKIAVLSLNPHSFEFTCGAEAKILSAIKRARKLGIRLNGPIPADSAFTFTDKLYDGYVAMYHDQALLPVKLLSHTQGVNITIGLPIIRISPLHGVAFDIAGKGIANHSSMVNAIDLAFRFSCLS